MKDRIIRGDSVLHYSFQAISSNYILFLLFPYTCFWKEEAEQETSNQFSRMLCNTGSDWEGKKHYLELSQEIGIRSLSSYGRVLKTDREEKILQNLQE